MSSGRTLMAQPERDDFRGDTCLKHTHCRCVSKCRRRNCTTAERWAIVGANLAESTCRSGNKQTKLNSHEAELEKSKAIHAHKVQCFGPRVGCGDRHGLASRMSGGVCATHLPGSGPHRDAVCVYDTIDTITFEGKLSGGLAFAWV